MKTAVQCATSLYQHHKGLKMNWDQIEGNWKQLKGNVKQQWGELTDDQLDIIAGKHDQLVGHIQKTYGHTKADVEKQIVDWQAKQKEIVATMKAP
jgi:uncharacterized protein YjbJ (UPF0337 family)